MRVAENIEVASSSYVPRRALRKIELGHRRGRTVGQSVIVCNDLAVCEARENGKWTGRLVAVLKKAQDSSRMELI